MRRAVIGFFCLAALVPFPAAAEDVECSRFVAAVGKIVRVPCDESNSPNETSEDGDAGPALQLTPAQTERTALQRDQLARLAEALRSAQGDPTFRDSYCTTLAMASVVQNAKNRRLRKKLYDETIAMQVALGERGRLVAAAMTKPVTEPLLNASVDEGGAGAHVRDTMEGRTFVRIRDKFQMSCACMRRANDPNRVICCDGCTIDTLKARF